eukprot:4796096-Pyramimonas_sp.AAC.1
MARNSAPHPRPSWPSLRFVFPILGHVINLPSALIAPMRSFLLPGSFRGVAPQMSLGACILVDLS